MKVTLSISDHLFHATEKLILQRGISRSAFYDQAIHGLLLRELEDEEMTENYNHVFSGFDSSLDPAWQAHANSMLARIEWEETADITGNSEEKP
jgi:hypothetical protein